jgi:pimeloyl-ACP methyl ester carboxylesterase
MPELQRPTVTLHYEDSGTSIPGKPTLVFLHGWCDGSASWADTIAVLGGDFRCLAPDMRGHGKSAMPRDHAYGAEALSNDVVALCESLGVEHPVLIGHSFGGYLAAEVARRFPGFARAIVDEDQPLDLRGFGEQMRALEAVIRSPESHMAFRTQLFDSMVNDRMPAEGRALIGHMKDATPIEVGQALWAALFEFTPDELAARSDGLMEAMANHPALSIDHEEPPGYYETLHWFAPNARTKVIECGHWIHLERPSEFRAALREFLAGV